MSDKSGVVVLLVRGEDTIYLSRRINCRGFNGLLQGCGGRVEEGETPLQAARREIKEEAGLDIWECRIDYIGLDPEQLNSAGEPFALHVCRVELIDGEVPKHTEPDLHGPWEPFKFSAMYERGDLMPGLRSTLVRNELLMDWGPPVFQTVYASAKLLAELYDFYTGIGILRKPQDEWDEFDVAEYAIWARVRRNMRRIPAWMKRRQAPTADTPEKAGK